MTMDVTAFKNSVTTLINHLLLHHGDDATLETYVICARVKSPRIPGGSGLNWVVNSGGDALAPGLLRSVLEALEGDLSNGGRS